MLENVSKQITMCITQAEMLGQDYEEAKQNKTQRTRKQKKKNGAYSNNYVNSQLKKDEKKKRRM